MKNSICNLIKGFIEKLCCKHKWELYEKVHYINLLGYNTEYHILICNKCGKIKRIKIYKK